MNVVTEKPAKQRIILLAVLIILLLLAVLAAGMFPSVSKSRLQAESVGIAENRAGELVFDAALEEYVQRFNEAYQADYHRDYLANADEWHAESCERGIHSAYETICYDFSEDYNVWTLPTISAYTASDTGLIQEVAVNFDDHSYQPDMYALYEELCYYTLQVFFPDVSDETLAWLEQMLNNYAYQNTLPNEQGFKADCVPLILYHHNNIGVYSYFAIGESMHFCIIPVNETVLNSFRANGTEIHEMPTNGSYGVIGQTVDDTAGLPDDELAYVTETCHTIAEVLARQTNLAQTEPSRNMPGQTVLTQESMDIMETLLIQNGYAVLDTDSRYPAFVQNAEGLLNFQTALKNGDAVREGYVWLSPYGGFHYCMLEQRSGKTYFLEAAAEWNEQDDIEITELYKREVLDIAFTDNGHLYYKLYEAHSPAFEDYTLLRLYAPDKELCDLSARYIEPVGYQGNNLFSSEWNAADYRKLCLNDVLEFLYREQTGAILDPLSLAVHENPFYYRIPASTFESIITAYFDIAPENLRETCCYDTDTDTYPWLDVAYDNLSYFPLITPDVKACRQNTDGTLTLTVDAMCVGLKTDSLFRHELTVRPDADDGFQYVSNRIIKSSDQLPEYIPRLEMQR